VAAAGRLSLLLLLVVLLLVRLCAQQQGTGGHAHINTADGMLT
jgi:hypothetical protein